MASVSSTVKQGDCEVTFTFNTHDWDPSPLRVVLLFSDADTQKGQIFGTDSSERHWARGWEPLHSQSAGYLKQGRG